MKSIVEDKTYLKDPALQSIAEIVHDIDLKDNKYGRKEADGIAQIVTGLSQKLKNDNKLLEKGLEIFDALYQNYSSTYNHPSFPSFARRG